MKSKYVTVKMKSAKVKILYANTAMKTIEETEVLIDNLNEKSLEKTAKTFVHEGCVFLQAEIVERIDGKIGIPMNVFLTFATPIVTVNDNEVQDLSDEANKYVQPKLNVICNEITRAKNRIKEIGLEAYEAEKEAKRKQYENVVANANN